MNRKGIFVSVLHSKIGFNVECWIAGGGTFFPRSILHSNDNVAIFTIFPHLYLISIAHSLTCVMRALSAD